MWASRANLGRVEGHIRELESLLESFLSLQARECDHVSPPVQKEPCTFTESEDIEEVLGTFFEKLCTKNGKLVSKETIQNALNNLLEQKSYVVLKQILEKERKGYLDKSSFQKIAKKAGIASGQRIKWVKQHLNLDGRLARLLKVGDPSNEFSGMLKMTEEDCEAVLWKLFKEIEQPFKSCLRLLQEQRSVGSGQVEEIHNKFSGQVGNFGDTELFEEGLESQLGRPDPFILKGILHEHKSNVRKLTSNYKINYNDMEEYARIFGHPSEYKDKLSSREGSADIPTFLQEVFKGLHPQAHGPSESVLMALSSEFQELRTLYQNVCEINNGVYPGEEGYVQKSMDLEVDASLGSLSDYFNFEPYPVFLEKAVPTGSKFRYSFYAPLHFFGEGRDQELINSLKAAGLSPTVVGSRSYIYGEFQKLESKDHRALLVCEQRALQLRQLLRGSTLHDSDLAQILYEPEGIPKPECRAACIDRIVDEAFKASSRITLLEARRRVGLRELMEIEEVRGAGLRVEEAVQAYQYTGPLFQVRAPNSCE